jgi:hypothetical protein
MAEARAIASVESGSKKFLPESPPATSAPQNAPALLIPASEDALSTSRPMAGVQMRATISGGLPTAGTLLPAYRETDEWRDERQDTYLTSAVLASLP